MSKKLEPNVCTINSTPEPYLWGAKLFTLLKQTLKRVHAVFYVPYQATL